MADGMKKKKKAASWTKRVAALLGVSTNSKKKLLGQQQQQQQQERRFLVAQPEEKVVPKRVRSLRLERQEAAGAAAAAAAADAERQAPVEVASGRANRVIALGDGRHLSFAEAGDANGLPVLCFFGVGGSRYLVLLLDEVARKLGLRVISIDRPGFGRSTFVENRGFSDFAIDVETLCDSLNLEKLAVWGYSVGCAYAATCCMRPGLRKRLVARATFVSPWVPLTAPGVPVHFSVARFFPRSLAEILKPNDVQDRRAELKRRGSETLIKENLALSAPSDNIDRLQHFFGPSSSFDATDHKKKTKARKQSPRAGNSSSSLTPTAAPKNNSSMTTFFLCGGGLFNASDKNAAEDSSSSEEDEVFDENGGSRRRRKKDNDFGELTDIEMRALEMLPRGPRVLLASVIESQRQGARGFSDEFRLCCSDFDFDYANLAWPTRVYHGTDDNLVSTASMRWLVSRLRRHLPDESFVELFQVLGGTHNGMVFAILKRSLTAIANDLKSSFHTFKIDTSSRQPQPPFYFEENNNNNNAKENYAGGNDHHSEGNDNNNINGR